MKNSLSRVSLRPTAILIAAVVFLFFSTCSYSLPMMGAGTGLRIERIVYHDAEKFPLPAGWEVAGWHYTDFDIFVRLEKEAVGEAVFRLVCTSLPSGKTLVGESRNFRMELVYFSPGVAESEPAAAGRALLERIRHNEPPRFFDHRDMKNREGMYEYLFRKYIFLPVLITGLVLSVVFFAVCFPVVRANLFPAGGKEVAILVLLIVVGAAVRITLAPDAPVHNNGHGFREIRAIVYQESPEQKEMMYGRVYITLMRSLAGAVGGTDEAVFAVNTLFGTLAVVSMYMLARALLMSGIAAFTAAAAVSFCPALVWLSGSESPASMHLFFALAGLAFASVSARERNVPLLWLACIFVCIASSLRLITMPTAPVAVLVFLYSLSGSSGNETPGNRSFRKHAVFCLVVLITWVFFHFLSLDPVNFGKGMDRVSPSVYLHHMRIYNILFDPTLSPVCLPYIAAAGFAVTLWKRPLLAVLLAVVFVMVVPVSFTTMADRTDFLRYQPQTHWIYFLLAGAVAAFIRRSSLPAQVSLPAAALVPAAIVLFSMSGLEFIGSGNEEIEEYRFIKSMAVGLEPGNTILLPVSSEAGDDRMISDFPDYLGELRIEKGNRRRTGDPVTIYVGLDCYRYDDTNEMELESVEGGMRRECAAACGERRELLSKKELEIKIPKGVLHKRYFMLGTESPVIGFYDCPAVEAGEAEGTSF